MTKFWYWFSLCKWPFWQKGDQEIKKTRVYPRVFGTFGAKTAQNGKKGDLSNCGRNLYRPDKFVWLLTVGGSRNRPQRPFPGPEAQKWPPEAKNRPIFDPSGAPFLDPQNGAQGGPPEPTFGPIGRPWVGQEAKSRAHGGQTRPKPAPWEWDWAQSGLDWVIWTIQEIIKKVERAFLWS